MKKIINALKLLKYLRTTHKKYFYEVSKGKWMLNVMVTDEEVIKFLRKELSK